MPDFFWVLGKELIMLPVKALLFLLVALMASGDAWARGGGGFHGGGFRGGGGGGWHGSPGIRGHGGFPAGGWRGTRRYGGNAFWAGRHFGHPGYGFFFGGYPYWPGYGYYWPYSSYGSYYSPNIVVEPVRPPVYIEQGSASGIQPLESGQWQYCANPEGYYPYVKECAAGWETLDPQPQGHEPGYWYYCDEPAGYYPYVRGCVGPWRKIVP
ncbi:hypothetical protein GPROT1_00241 [Gammaproteobacteria bacterium]|nr:hypothetical protein GPROT1_00241 [Gammaproteobacteria bacterium]